MFLMAERAEKFEMIFFGDGEEVGDVGPVNCSFTEWGLDKYFRRTEKIRNAYSFLLLLLLYCSFPFELDY